MNTTSTLAQHHPDHPKLADLGVGTHGGEDDCEFTTFYFTFRYHKLRCQFSIHIPSFTYITSAALKQELNSEAWSKQHKRD